VEKEHLSVPQLPPIWDWDSDLLVENLDQIAGMEA
jgi:hypothetical protein